MNDHRQAPPVTPGIALVLTTSLVASSLVTTSASGLTFSASGLDPNQVRVTEFASGLNYPVGMTSLDDGSLLVAVTNGSNYFTASSGSILRLADTDGDGVSDVQETLVSNVSSGKLTALDRAGDLVVVTGQGSGAPISFYRLGSAPSDPLQFVGRLDLSYPSGGWQHPHSSLLLRAKPATTDQYELYFQVGSDTNFATTTRTVNLSGTLGLVKRLAGDAIHRVDLVDGPGGLTATGTTQIATGLRNPTGIAFHPGTGDLYLGDNGIDGIVDANEPTSADEINVLPAAQLGNSIVDFGFPGTYEEYRTQTTIGSSGVLPWVAFQPVPPPNGEEAEGVNEIAFAPPLFPAPLADGVFAGFHGRFNLGGTSNEENPLVFSRLADGSYEHVVTVDQADVGHLDGLLSTPRTLYVSDVSPLGGFSGSAAGKGKIYAITSLLPPGDYNRDARVDGADLLRWQREYASTQAPYTGADGDGSGVVDDLDLAIWSGQLSSTAAGRSVPEPGSILLMGLAVAALVAPWRRLSFHPRQTRER
jgi:glucose/arabinose dehydrogenase